MSAQTGVDPAADSLLLDDLLQEGDEAPAVGGAQALHQLLFVLERDLPPAGEEAAAGGRQIEGVDPAVTGMGAALDQPPRLELVDDRDHPARRGADRLRDRLLGAALDRVDHVHHPELRRLEVDLCDSAGEALVEMRRLTSDYTAPEDACNTFKVLYFELAEMERDLHRHIHLENNILFPRAIALE